MRCPNTGRLISTGHGHLFKAKADFFTTLAALSNKSLGSEAEHFGVNSSELPNVRPCVSFWFVFLLLMCSEKLLQVRSSITNFVAE